ncbi:MAG: secretin and TonB N-terminal domain-containing protein [Fimbriimonadaceae bacterium]
MKKMLLGLSLATLASVACAEGKLTGFETNKVGDGLKVTVKGEDLAQPKIIRTMGGKSYMLEFDARLIGKASNEKVDWGGVSTVAAYWYQARPVKVRIHLRVNPESNIDVTQVDGQWTLAVNAPATDKFAVTNVAPKGTQSLPEIISSPVAAPVASPIEKSKKVTVQPKAGDNDGLKAIMSLSEPKAPAMPSFITMAASPVTLDGTPVPAPKAEPKAKTPKATQAKVVIPATTVQSEPKIVFARSASSGSIDLDFANADVVQVLRALAMQANVNIVTAPDVKGQVTVSLQNVSVEEALNLICALSSLHYAKRNNTYVVAANSAVLRGFGPASANSETRVVPIYSGEGTQIKAAILKSVPFDSNNGGFELVLPSEQLSISSTDVVGDSGAGDQKQGGTQEGTKLSTSTGAAGTSKKDTYVVVIGAASKLDSLERQVRMIDEQICFALGVEVPTSTAMVRETYYTKGTKASFLLTSLAGKSEGGTFAKIGTTELRATPITSISEQAISLYGRSNEVARIIADLKALDEVGADGANFQTYDLRYSDPRSVKQELENQFPGLQVSILPSSVSSPGLFKEQSKQQEVSGGGASSQTQSGSSATTGGSSNEIVSDEGLIKPYDDFEKGAYAMKLVLRGTQDKIASALSYLKSVDVCPKRVALELRVMDINKNDAETKGIKWDLAFGSVVTNVGKALGTNFGTIGSSLNFGKGNVGSVTAALDALVTDQNLIARPNLLAMDGRQSELFVGDVINYIKQIQATQNGITVQTDKVNVGVRLSVLPRIGADGKITIDMRPVVSILKGFTDIPGGGQLPQTGIRVVQQTAVLNDGDTIAMGGLIQDSDSVETSGVPILKDLPLIGKLFSSTTRKKNRSEVVFFLTAKIVDDETNKTAANPKNGDVKKGGN